jgi:hypothetical protein
MTKRKKSPPNPSKDPKTPIIDITKQLKNKRHELYAANLIKKNWNQTQAYRETYPNATYDSAKSKSSKTLIDYPEITNRAIAIAQMKGLTLEHTLEGLYKLTTAKKDVILNKEFAKVDDNSVRSKAIELVMRMYGVLQSNNTPNDHKHIHFHLDKEDIKDLKTLMLTIKEDTSISEDQSNKFGEEV